MNKSLTNTEVKILPIVLCVLLFVVLIGVVAKRKRDSNKEMLKKRFLIKSKKSEVHAIKQDKEKYKLLQPKLEVISQRLGKLANDGTQPQDLASPRSIQLSDRKEILFINDDGDIIVDADKFFDILDKNNYITAFIIDIPSIGRVKIQAVFFVLVSIIFLVMSSIFNQASSGLLMGLFFLSSFVGVSRHMPHIHLYLCNVLIVYK